MHDGWQDWKREKLVSDFTTKTGRARLCYSGCNREDQRYCMRVFQISAIKMQKIGG
jgi:hypothetical protein